MTMRQVTAHIPALVCFWASSAHLAMCGAGTSEGGGMPGLPAGVTLGMTPADLLKIRPGVQPWDFRDNVDLKTTDLSKGPHVLGESMKDAELFQTAAYFFKDGRCVGFALEGHHWRPEAAKRRARILSQLVAAFGGGYERKLLRKSLKEVTFLAPAFLWRDKGRCVALTVSQDYPAVTFDLAVIQLNVWQADQKGLSFEKEADPALVNMLFGPLEKAAAGK